jgi:apolipoprotein N-acyltransferase
LSSKQFFYSIGIALVSGVIFGIIVALSIAYTTFIQFHWLPEAHLFTSIVRLSFIPITIASAVIWGFLAFVYGRIKTGMIVLDAVLLALIWVFAEKLFAVMLGNYNLAMLGFAVSPVLRSTQFAALGGVLFVSFIVALINSFLAAFLFAGIKKNKSDLKNLVIFLACSVIFLGIANIVHKRYLAGGAGEEKRLSVAIIQNSDRKKGAFGAFTQGIVSFPKLEQEIQKAVAMKPDVVIYPFNPYVGALSENSEIGVQFNTNVIAGSVLEFAAWTKKHIPNITAFITWNTVFRNGSFFNEFNVWENGALTSFYQKRVLFPFMDYTPAFARQRGFFTTPFDASPGHENQEPIVFRGFSAESLICSEVHDAFLVSPKNRDLILSLGSDAMFYGDVVAYIDFVIAQYRAVEYHMPAIRGNRFGPSALIDADGRIIAKMDSGQEGVLFGTISYSPNTRQTL